MRTSIVMMILILVTCGTAYPKDSISSQHEVGIIIQCDDIQLKKSIQHYLEQQLRSFPDVVIKAENPYHIIRLVVLPDILSENRSPVYSISFTFLQTQDYRKSLRGLIKKRHVIVSEKYESLLFSMFEPRRVFIDQGLMIAGVDKLKKACDNIIIYFNKSILQKRREAIEFWKSLKRQNIL